MTNSKLLSIDVNWFYSGHSGLQYNLLRLKKKSRSQINFEKESFKRGILVFQWFESITRAWYSGFSIIRTLDFSKLRILRTKVVSLGFALVKIFATPIFRTKLSFLVRGSKNWYSIVNRMVLRISMRYFSHDPSNIGKTNKIHDQEKSVAFHSASGKVWPSSMQTIFSNSFNKPKSNICFTVIE